MFVKIANYDLGRARRPLPWAGTSAWAVCSAEDAEQLRAEYPELAIEAVEPPAGTVALAVEWAAADGWVCDEDEPAVSARPEVEFLDLRRHALVLSSQPRCHCGCDAAGYQTVFETPWQVIFAEAGEAARALRYTRLKRVALDLWTVWRDDARFADLSLDDEWEWSADSVRVTVEPLTPSDGETLSVVATVSLADGSVEVQPSATHSDLNDLADAVESVLRETLGAPDAVSAR